MPTGLARCSVGPGISRGARKLARTPRVIKKKMYKINCWCINLKKSKIQKMAKWLKNKKKKT